MGTRKLVSVVDDDEFVREALPDLLRSYGLEALPFGSAEDFLASEHLGRTGCLILDVSMPGMSGPDLQIELAERKINIPIVFITANTDSLGWEVPPSGTVACLTKPFSDAAILEAVNSALDMQGHLE
jgi:FixJ family two-component response regulator